MDDATHDVSKNNEHVSEEVRNVSEKPTEFRKPASESFGNVPKDDSEIRKEFGKSSETFRNVSERSPDHTLTVRDVAHVFEEQGLAITERTVINWCNPNKKGIRRLDCYFDAGDGKYFITTHSVERVVIEEAEGEI